MAEKNIVNSRYFYTHETGKWPSQTVDLHHVAPRKSHLQNGVACFSALLLLLSAYCSFVEEGESLYGLLFCFVIAASLVSLSRRRFVEKESVVIIPAFGVQLQTHYRSGRAVRRFVPIDKILKPVLNECVTPVTCYWTLALVLRDEDELMLVFKEFRPPLKMLAPIWKALCAATDPKESLETCLDTSRMHM